MITILSQDIRSNMRIPYGLRRIPPSKFATLLSCPSRPKSGDIALGRLEKIGKNARLELVNGRPATLHEGDLLAVVFGNRYATEQFEGYARINGDACDLLSQGGLCGLVESRHASVPEPSKLRILGALGDADGRSLRLRDFGVSPSLNSARPQTVVVCGTSMDSGKTHTAGSLIIGLRKLGELVAGIKLTGTAAGRDTWFMLDAGASPALDFVDGGFPSTYLATLGELLWLQRLLIAHAASLGAQWVVIEIADGLLQTETAALLQCPAFTKAVNHWVFATGDPLAADGGVRVLREWGIEPIVISGVISMSPLGMREAQAATGVRCLTAKELQSGGLNKILMKQGADKVNCPHLDNQPSNVLEAASLGLVPA
jgi:hypothetical protein